MGHVPPFPFLNPGRLWDCELVLVLAGRSPPDPARGLSPAYHFHLVVYRRQAGTLSLRIGHTPALELYAGHVGYEVAPRFRGRRLAERACRLVLPLARAHGLDPLWITCDPDNRPSRRTCERLGARLVEIVPVPPDTPMYRQGEHRKCRYRLDLG
jgi:tagatose 1,6-diphosphate aldolase